MFVKQVALQSCVLYFPLYTTHIYTILGAHTKERTISVHLSRDFMRTPPDIPRDFFSLALRR
jgi:hypothetical protein